MGGGGDVVNSGMGGGGGVMNGGMGGGGDVRVMRGCPFLLCGALIFITMLL